MNSIEIHTKRLVLRPLSLTYLETVHEYASNIENNVGELGWIINKKYWNHGFACESALALIEFAKQWLGLTHYIAHCDADNIGSYRVMEKIGMVRTGEYGGRKNKASDDERREYRYELI